jgi:hypothetical protein
MSTCISSVTPGSKRAMHMPASIVAFSRCRVPTYTEAEPMRDPVYNG